ncbi:hypothetical protein ACLKMH_20190 [Psychromonas sp. KJ10-10]
MSAAKCEDIVSASLQAVLNALHKSAVPFSTSNKNSVASLA